jgi:hypothetical protein
MNWKGSNEKWSWLNWSYYPGTYMGEQPRKAAVRIADLRADI